MASVTSRTVLAATAILAVVAVIALAGRLAIWEEEQLATEASLHRLVEALQSRNDVLTAELEDAAAKYADLEDTNAGLLEDNQDLKASVARLEDDTADQDREIGALLAKQERLATQFAQCEMSHQNLQNSERRATTDLEQLRTQHEELRGTVRDIASALGFAEGSNPDLVHEIDQMIANCGNDSGSQLRDPPSGAVEATPEAIANTPRAVE